MTSVPQILAKLSSWVSAPVTALRGIFASSHPRIDPFVLDFSPPAIQPHQNPAVRGAINARTLAHEALPRGASSFEVGRRSGVTAAKTDKPLSMAPPRSVAPWRPEPDLDPLMQVRAGGLGLVVRSQTFADRELTKDHPRRIGTWEISAPIKVPPLVTADRPLISMATMVWPLSKLEDQDLATLHDMEALLKGAKIGQVTLTRAEGYLRRLSTKEKVTLTLSEAVLGCVIVAEKYGSDDPSPRGRWDALLKEVSPMEESKSALWRIERGVLIMLDHNVADINARVVAREGDR